MADYISSLTGVAMDMALQDMAEHNSEAWAVGERNGIPVGSDDVTYQNNAQYYAQQAQSIAPASVTEAVRWDIAQTALTDANKAQARSNIDAGKNGAWSNRNLLDNAYFVGGGSQLGGETFPINQRGKTSYTSGGTGIDRWCTDLPSGNGVTLTASGVTLDGGVYWGQHRVAKDLAGETLTLSVMLADGTIYSGTAVYNHEVGVGYTFFGNGLMACYALRLGSSDVAQFEISTYTAITVKAMKLEKGTISTLANDTIPSFDEELRKCQRFFCSSFPLTTAPEAGNTAEWYASMGTARNNGCYSVWFPVEMYSVPTVLKLGMAYVFAAYPDGTENTTYDTSIAPANITTKGFRANNSFYNGFATFGFSWYASCEI